MENLKTILQSPFLRGMIFDRVREIHQTIMDKPSSRVKKYQELVNIGSLPMFILYNLNDLFIKELEIMIESEKLKDQSKKTFVNYQHDNCYRFSLHHFFNMAVRTNNITIVKYLISLHKTTSIPLYHGMCPSIYYYPDDNDDEYYSDEESDYDYYEYRDKEDEDEEDKDEEDEEDDDNDIEDGSDQSSDEEEESESDEDEDDEEDEQDRFDFVFGIPKSIEMLDYILQTKQFLPAHVTFKIGNLVRGINWVGDKDFNKESIHLQNIVKQLQDYKEQLVIPSFEKIPFNDTIQWLLFEVGIISPKSYPALFRTLSIHNDIDSVKLMLTNDTVVQKLTEFVLQDCFKGDGNEVDKVPALPCLEILMKALPSSFKPGDHLFKYLFTSGNFENNKDGNYTSVLTYMLNDIDRLKSIQEKNNSKFKSWRVDSNPFIPTPELFHRILSTPSIQIKPTRLVNSLVQMDNVELFEEFIQGKSILFKDKSLESKIFISLREVIKCSVGINLAHHIHSKYFGVLTVQPKWDPFSLYRGDNVGSQPRYLEIIELFIPSWSINIGHVQSSINHKCPLQVLKIVHQYYTIHSNNGDMGGSNDELSISSLLDQPIETVKFVMESYKQIELKESLFSKVKSIELFQYLWSKYPKRNNQIQTMGVFKSNNIEIVKWLHAQLSPTLGKSWLLNQTYTIKEIKSKEILNFIVESWGGVESFSQNQYAAGNVLITAIQLRDFELASKLYVAFKDANTSVYGMYHSITQWYIQSVSKEFTIFFNVMEFITTAPCCKSFSWYGHPYTSPINRSSLYMCAARYGHIKLLKYFKGRM